MHDKYEIEGLDIGHAVEDEHRLYGKVPRTRTIGRGNNDGYCAYNECY